MHVHKNTMTNENLKRAALSSTCLSVALPEESATANQNTCLAAVFVVSNVCDQSRGPCFLVFDGVSLQGSLVLWIQGVGDNVSCLNEI